jgi:Ca-activated chloride channel family protein
MSLSRSPFVLLAASLLLGGCSMSMSLDRGAGGADYDEDGMPPAEARDEGVDDTCEGARTTPTTFFMSADDSNSQAAPALARHLIEQGSRAPGQAAIHEFLNYYDFDFAPAPAGEVRIEAQLRPIAGEEAAYTILVSAVAEERTLETRRPLNLVFSLDSSCSMGGQGMEMAKESMEQITASLREGDLVSIVSWSRDAATILEAREVSGASDPVLVELIQGIQEGGGTDLSAGLLTAYEVANRHHSPQRLSRVVLLSDGGANLGQTDATVIGGAADDSQGNGIYLVGVGGGDPGAYRHQLMDEVTDLGKGSYIYIDRAEEAEHQFRGRRFVANLDVAALNVRLAVELPAGFVIEEFHGEEINENPDEVEPQHLAPNDSMQYHFEIQDCPGAPEDRDERFTFTITWTDPATGEERSGERSLLLADLLDGDVRQLVKADAIIEYAQALADLDGLDTPQRRNRLNEALDVVGGATEAFPADADLAEVQRLLTTLRAAQ